MGQKQPVSNQTTHNLILFIDTNNTNKATDLLKSNPDLINTEIPGTNTTPLCRSAQSNNYSMCRVLLGMGADPNLFSNNESPLMIAAQRNNIQIVELLVEYRASTRDCNANKLNALDIAILYGNYTIALYLVKDHKMMVLKDANLYRKIARERGIDYFVDYVKMLDCLSKQLDDLSIPDLFDESNAETYKLVDPVLDPNETWGQFVTRLVKCDPAPLVERSSLPRDKQPQNRMLGKVHYYLDKIKPKGRTSMPLSLNPKSQTSLGLDSQSRNNDKTQTQS